MVLSLAQLNRYNPWWTAADWRQSDPFLASLDRAPVALPAPSFVETIELGRPAIHIVRGPRQVGKSTGLKLLAARALEAGVGTRSIVYLALDLLAERQATEVAEAIAAAKETGGGEGGGLLLLDEVTAVKDWASVVKSLWDDGTIRADVVVCTGSSAIDLADGAVERLPGRRRAGDDHLLLPQSFAQFAHAFDHDIPASPGLGLADFFADAGRQELRQAQAFLPRLDRALARYLRFGGLPASVVEALTEAEAPSAETMRILWDSLAREVLRKGASEVALQALLERVASSLGAKTNWSHLAREMDVPLGRRSRKADYRDVGDYVEFLARCYSLLAVYFWKVGHDSSDLRRDKKLYFGDPLLYTIVRERAPGLALDEPAAVENALALALYRRYEPAERQAGGFVQPGEFHVYETARREIDFVCGPRRELSMLEIKYRRKTGATDTLSMRKAFPGRPAVLATREDLVFKDEYVLAPAALVLWALG